MNKSRDVIIRRLSTNEIISDAYFIDMGHIGDEPYCGHLSRVVIDGKNYDSLNPCGLENAECYRRDLINFEKQDIGFVLYER